MLQTHMILSSIELWSIKASKPLWRLLYLSIWTNREVISKPFSFCSSHMSSHNLGECGYSAWETWHTVEGFVFQWPCLASSAFHWRKTRGRVNNDRIYTFEGDTKWNLKGLLLNIHVCFFCYPNGCIRQIRFTTHFWVQFILLYWVFFVLFLLTTSGKVR